MRNWLVILVLLCHSGIITGQTCCSGGIPLTGNLGIASTEEKTLQILATYDFNSIRSLFSESERLEDDTRRRSTHSFLLELGYTFPKGISLSVLLSGVSQSRVIPTFTGFPDKTVNWGIGDPVILPKYKLPLKRKEHNWQIGTGVKVPLAPTNHRSENGILLPADLQTGSGSWDGIFWSIYQYNFKRNPNWQFITMATYRLSGINRRDEVVQQLYQFGNEIQIRNGISWRTTFQKRVVDWNISHRIRHVGEDETNGNPIPNTGGTWLFISPNVGVTLNPKLKVLAGGQIPYFVSIRGTQLSTSYALSAGIQLTFRKKQLISI